MSKNNSSLSVLDILLKTIRNFNSIPNLSVSGKEMKKPVSILKQRIAESKTPRSHPSGKGDFKTTEQAPPQHQSPQPAAHEAGPNAPPLAREHTRFQTGNNPKNYLLHEQDFICPSRLICYFAPT
jgi:hypothetical protein